MRLGFVVQRYGPGIDGGAELHCRLVAEHLGRTHDVSVFTTCARDYVTWKNTFPRGKTHINGVHVFRFPVRRARNIRRFIDIQNLVFHVSTPPRDLQVRWIRENGPYSPALVRAVSARKDIDVWILFSYRYWTTVESLRRTGSRAILVPTAEDDPAIRLSVFRDIFNAPAAIAYNSPEERALIGEVSGNENVPGEIVGVGLPEQDPKETSPADLEAKTRELAALKPYVLYIGRIDKNKGCDHLFRLFRRFHAEVSSDITLLLIGSAVMEIPKHPNIRHLGFVSEAVKNAALDGAEALIMPSPFESLSMVTLEAWRRGRPVIANRRCAVLEGQCMRAGGGLTYGGFEEFSHCLQLLHHRHDLADRLGEQGRRYFQRHYAWPVIESKYRTLIDTVMERIGRRNKSDI